MSLRWKIAISVKQRCQNREMSPLLQITCFPSAWMLSYSFWMVCRVANRVFPLIMREKLFHIWCLMTGALFCWNSDPENCIFCVVTFQNIDVAGAVWGVPTLYKHFSVICRIAPRLMRNRHSVDTFLAFSFTFFEKVELFRHLCALS